jgi:ferredoxin--NADP+ reductase
VAPDHPNIKAVSRVYEKTAQHPEFRFFGNVELGRDVTREELLERYHAVIYAVGAQIDRQMGIPGEDLPGSRSATEFVAWYNGHPDYCELEFDLSCERAVVVGNGNVAADVARMLALTRDELATTDVADHAIDVLAESRIKEIVVLGRRGPAQAAFTNPELLELGEMTDADVYVDERDVELDPLSSEWLEGEGSDITSRKNVEILTEYSESITIRRNKLERDEQGVLRPKPTDETETIPVGLVFRSIGYKAIPLEGVPFDERRAVVPNEAGRVLGDDGKPRPGEYVVGWIKRGPTGIIGTNKRDAQETVNTLLEDLEEGRLPQPQAPDRGELEEILRERKPDLVTYAGWEAIDRAEREAGEPHGRPRVKYTTFEELLEAASTRPSRTEGALTE